MNENKPCIVFLTGASGSGKTTLLNALKKRTNNCSTVCLHFDNIGVPSEEEMIKKYDSPREWQRAMTHRWIKKIMREYNNKKLVILEGQVDLSFIVNAFKDINFFNYKIILAHCDHSVRHERLRANRNQPELINENMDNWSNFLKQQALEMNVLILDTTLMNKENMVDYFLKYIENSI